MTVSPSSSRLNTLGGPTSGRRVLSRNSGLTMASSTAPTGASKRCSSRNFTGRLLLGRGAREHGEHVGAVALGLDGAEAGHGEQPAAIVGLGLGEGGKGGVVEDHVGGNARPLGGGRPPGLECLEQGRVGAVEDG